MVSAINQPSNIRPSFFTRIWQGFCRLVGLPSGKSETVSAQTKQAMHLSADQSLLKSIKDSALGYITKFGSSIPSSEDLKQQWRNVFYVGSYGRNPLTLENIRKVFQERHLTTGVENRVLKSKGTDGKPRDLNAFVVSGSSPIVYLTGINSSGGTKLRGLTAWGSSGIGSITANYNGFGETYGQAFNEQTLIEDAKALILEAAKSSTSNKINIVSHSMGSAIATKALTELSSQGLIKKDVNLVIVSGWDSFQKLASYHGNRWAMQLPIINKLVSAAFGESWETADNLKALVNNLSKRGLKLNLQIYHGNKDTVVPIEYSQNLYKNLSDEFAKNQMSMSYSIIDGADHFSSHDADKPLPYLLFANNINSHSSYPPRSQSNALSIFKRNTLDLSF